MESRPDLSGVIPLERQHDVKSFDCGVPALNEYLQKKAWQNQNRYHSARTFVVVREGRVVAYYTLAYGSVEQEVAPGRMIRGVGRHRVPVIVLGRLAVDMEEQGQKLGSGLLKNAILRAAQAAEHAGLKAMMVHAKDDRARQLYLRASFEESPVHPLTLFVSIEDIIATARSIRTEAKDSGQAGPGHG